ncbi:MAG: glucose-6-phosphate dehydrogenase [Psittacicella sp.]
MSKYTLVIFGASGDLTKRLLMPSLISLYKTNKLAEKFTIIGVSRTKFSDEEYREKLKNDLANNKYDEKLLNNFLSHIYYQPIDTADPEDYSLVNIKLKSINKNLDKNNILFYLSTPPILYKTIVKNLSSVGLNQEKDGWKRFIIEKPFGYDLSSAIDLNKELAKDLNEDQIYRIDHYLGKEAVQNLIVTRFANPIFETIWDNKHIDYIEITSAESIGVEKRGGYYDNAGAMRDMLQNHILQTLAIFTMEAPQKMDANGIRDQITALIKNIKIFNEKDLNTNLVLGQYSENSNNDQKLPGYLDEEGIAKDSKTETFIALKLNIQNKRWSDTPIYIRIGKRLPKKLAEITIHFKENQNSLFKNSARNSLIFEIQPDASLSFKFNLKEPGEGFNTREGCLDFAYSSIEKTTHLMLGYERLIFDALKGDATLFTRSDTIEACWSFVQPIIDYKNNNPKVYQYPCWSWGPKESDNLLKTIIER